MSIINKMLRDLDARQAANQLGNSGEAAVAPAAAVKPVGPRRDFGEAFWRVMGGIMVLVVGWIVWLIYQLSPSPLVEQTAFEARSRPRVAVSDAATSATTPTPIAITPVQPAATPAQPAPPAAVLPDSSTAAPASETPKIDMLKLTTELATLPLRPQGKALAAKVDAPTKRAVKSREEAAREAPAGVPAVALAAIAPSAAARPDAVAGAHPSSTGKIERRESATPRERAELELRRAVTLVNQGRIAEGMDAFRSALQLDPAHEVARQTMVALLVESKRTAEAEAALQEGIRINPDNGRFAILLARIMVERGDIAGALALLRPRAAAEATNAEYHAFVAALLQRLGQHRPAIEEYQAALRIAPATAIWWAGLAMSYEATEQAKDAGDAYRRAKLAGNLRPDLATFVDTKLRQLQ